MSERILNDFDIDAASHILVVNVCLSEWQLNAKQHIRIFVLQKLFIVAITNNASNRLIQCSLVLRQSKTVYKDKICVSVNRCFTM